jgi:hypothetical protein
MTGNLPQKTTGLIALAIGAAALGALAVGSMAIGYAAIGKLAIRRMGVGRARIGRLEIDKLVVRRLTRPDGDLWSAAQSCPWAAALRQTGLPKFPFNIAANAL